MGSDGYSSDSDRSDRSAAYHLKGDKIRDFIASKNIQPWIELSEMRKKAWKSEDASRHFKQQRQNADASNQNPQTQVAFLKVKFHVAKEIQHNTGWFTSVRCKNPRSVLAKPIRALDTSMAPGAYSQYFLSENPRATIDGLSLPVESGGHLMLLQDAGQILGLRPRPQGQENISLTWTDVTLHPLLLPKGRQFPEEFPDKPAFDSNTPLPSHLQSPPRRPSDRLYDLVISDGAYLRTHPHAQLRFWESGRLLVSQLVLGLTFIKPGGSMLVLLHHLEAWNSFATVYKFSRFANIRLYKPGCAHGIRSGFFLVATNVQPELEVCKMWVEELKRAWYTMTFEGKEGLGESVEAGEGLDVDKVLDEWGEEFVMLGQDVWRKQRDALRRKGWAE